MIYLDPEVDFTFKKSVREHPDLVTNWLNALLPLDRGRRNQGGGVSAGCNWCRRRR